MKPLAVLEHVCKEVPVSIMSPTMIGVYFLLDHGRVVYVGQNRDVETRVATHVAHRKRKPPHGKRFDRAIWIEVPAADLRRYEGALIRAFGPRYNNAAPTNRGDADILSALGIAPNKRSTASWRARMMKRRQRVGRKIKDGHAIRRRKMQPW